MRRINYIPNLTNQQANQKIANTMLTQYKKGVAINNLEMEQENDLANNNVGLVDSKSVVSVPTVKKQKGYSINDSRKTIHTVSNSVSSIKDFLRDSRLVDNELDQIMTMMKMDNVDSFYTGK